MTLVDSLRRKAKEDSEALWQTARAAAETDRAEKAHAVEEERARNAEELAKAAAAFARTANAGAERAARKILASSKAALAERLYRIATEALRDFRDGAYAKLFAALAAELPAGGWERIRVNPADRAIARKLFPRTTVVTDPAIAGGIDVEADGGRVHVDNTLEARLEAAWPEVLPGLMTAVLEEISHSEPRT
jgi:vacuolar-type H+-ATPase subunit E/Vma4